jgi:hypothetical protein
MVGYLGLTDSVATSAATEALRVPIHPHTTQVMAMSYLMLATTTHSARQTTMSHFIGETTTLGEVLNK